MRLSTVLAIAVSATLARAGDNNCHSPTNPPSHGCVNSPTNRQCWDGPWGNFDINTDYYENTPNTGKIAEVIPIEFIHETYPKYWLTVDNVTMAPDGVTKNMYVFNNSFPGPTLEANWGDTFVIHVQNNLQDNGYVSLGTRLISSTSIHWHGFLQHGTGANDGVPGVTQCKVPFNSSLSQ